MRILYLLESTLYIDLIKEGVSLKEVLKNQGRIVEKEEDFDTQVQTGGSRILGELGDGGGLFHTCEKI